MVGYVSHRGGKFFYYANAIKLAIGEASQFNKKVFT